MVKKHTLPSKLKFFCQMCNKQCRDGNGFKCHTDSASHRQQMTLFLADPEKYISQFSNEFEASFFAAIESDDWVPVAEVYNAVIRDPEHTHLNATRWTSLADFVEHAAAVGKLRTRNNPQGILFCQRIDSERDERLALARAKEERRLLRQEEREKEAAEKRLNSMPPVEPLPAPTTVQRVGDAKIKLAMPKKFVFKKPTTNFDEE